MLNLYITYIIVKHLSTLSVTIDKGSVYSTYHFLFMHILEIHTVKVELFLLADFMSNCFV